jgi:hypothetical protein
MKLSEIAKAYPTDKDFTHNYYEAAYESAFSSIREEVKLVCEIGIGGFWNEVGWVHGNSLKVWRDYFPNADILGLDIKEYQIEDLGRIRTGWLDQSKKDLVVDYASKLKDYDLIVDDGSHNIYDQQITLAYFFKCLKPGGIYILEDLHSSIEVNDLEKAKFWGWGEAGHITPLQMLEHHIGTKEIISDYLDEGEKQYLEQSIDKIEVFHIGPTSITSIIRKKI